MNKNILTALAVGALAGFSPALPRSLERPGQPKRKMYVPGGKPHDPFAILDPPLVTLSRQQRRRLEMKLEKMRLKVQRRNEQARQLHLCRQALAKEVQQRDKMLAGNFRTSLPVSQAA